MFKKITQSPYLNILSGLVLLAAAGYEVWLGIEEAAVGAHHGLVVYSLIHIIKVLPEVVHGFKELEEGEVLIENRVSVGKGLLKPVKVK